MSDPAAVRVAPYSFEIAPAVRSGLTTRHIGAVQHGFPSFFRDWAAEWMNHPREIVEAALAHVVWNKVEATRRTSLETGGDAPRHETALAP